ncbi:MAG TPA: GntR family transcriptional regulator [Caulobacteraceae bacterium]
MGNATWQSPGIGPLGRILPKSSANLRRLVGDTVGKSRPFGRRTVADGVDRKSVMGLKTESKLSGGPGDDARPRKASRFEGPLYLQLAQVLRDEIINGLYPVGSQIPTEDVLRERFAVSRFTVREAIRRLREDGLVSSRQGAGTVVVPVRASDSQVLNTVSIDDIVAFGAGTPLLIESIRLIKTDSKLAHRLGVAKGEEWLSVSGFRRGERDAAPICWADYYINRDYAAIGRQLPRHSGPIFQLIEDVFAVTITEVQQEISATVITPAMAERLKVPEGSAALEVRRIYKVDDDKVAQITINTHPASTYRHSMTMRRVKR